MMMMMRFAGERALWAFLWTVVLHVMSTTADHGKGFSPPSVLQRHKREWQWNMLIVYEEKPPQFPPEVIGKVRTVTLTTKTK